MPDKGSRTKNSMRNISVALPGQLLTILLQFYARRVFIQMLNRDLLGVNSIFGNILAVLSLAELGIGSAITFSLYQPLSQNDTDKICSIMEFYKWAYRIIAAIMAMVGIALIPFLKLIVKEEVAGLSSYYLLYLASTVISYLCAYKRTLIIADQRGYLSSMYRYTYLVCLNIVQIIILFTTKNYALFLIAQIVLSFVENILISRKADKLYPYLTGKASKLPVAERQNYYKNIKALLMHRIGSVMVTNTDSILLSAIVNVDAVSVYSNYRLVFSGINTIMAQLFSSVTASVGNLLVERERDYSYQLYRSILMLDCWLYGVISICLLVLFNDFIRLWVGAAFLERMDYVVILVAHFLIGGVREPTIIFKNALGLFWNDRYKAVIEAIVNVILSVILGLFYGARGIFGATVISALCIPFWVEPYVLFKKHWKRKLSEYFSFVFSLVGRTCVAALLLCIVFSRLQIRSWGGLIVKAAACFVLANLLFFAAVCRTKEFSMIVKMVKHVLSGIRKRFGGKG